MDKHVMIIFTKSSGKIRKTVEAYSSAMLQLTAMQNVRPTQDAIIFNKATGYIDSYIEGKSSGFPKVLKNLPDGQNNVENYCPGLLEVL